MVDPFFKTSFNQNKVEVCDMNDWIQDEYNNIIKLLPIRLLRENENMNLEKKRLLEKIQFADWNCPMMVLQQPSIWEELPSMLIHRRCCNQSNKSSFILSVFIITVAHLPVA